MIQANELRIGSLVDYFGKITTVVKMDRIGSAWYISTAKNIHELANTHNEIDAYSPIPLTEEWLFKFSFNWDGYHPDTAQREYYEDKSGFSICKKDNRFYYHKTKIETVHHLQNLYYFITGSELVLSTVPASNPS